MEHRRRILTIAVVALLLVAAWPGQRALAIGPTVIIFYGEPLKKQVVISGRDITLFGDLTHPLPPMPTSGRTFITVALFWGLASNPAGNGVPIAELTPAMASQHGRYYPATATQPAAIMMTTTAKGIAQPPPDASRGTTPFVWGGPLPVEAVALLKRLGIPTGPQSSR
jgi:hypothetical protein